MMVKQLRGVPGLANAITRASSHLAKVLPGIDFSHKSRAAKYSPGSHHPR